MPEKNRVTSHKGELEHPHDRENAGALLAQLKFNHVFAHAEKHLFERSSKAFRLRKIKILAKSPKRYGGNDRPGLLERSAVNVIELSDGRVDYL